MKQHLPLSLYWPINLRSALRTAVLGTALGLALGVTACSPATTVPAEQITTSDTSPDFSEAVSDTVSNTASDVASDVASPETKVFAEDGIAIAGADPVAYFTDEQFVSGSAEYTHEWQGTTWQFANAENRDRFANDPAAYAPQYGGYCAWAVGQNTLAAIDPNAWDIIDGKLYLNANDRIQTRWSKDIPGNIALAEANWPALSQ